MEITCRIAFKEWAAVCQALAEGVQTIILRKGGIHEGDDGFRLSHREFWLFPTQFHQQPEQLVPAAEPLLRRAIAGTPQAGVIPIGRYVVVEEVHEIADEALLDRLTGLHIWSADTVNQRFHYRQPGLFLLLVRTYCLPQPIPLADEPYFAGCRSWVELPEALSSAGATAVLSDERFAEMRQAVRNALR